MVSVMKGLDVRKSRFAALSLEDSDSEDGEIPWQQVVPTKSKPPPKKGPPISGGQAQGEEAKGLSKNAKKRARKRRNKSTSSDHDGNEAAAPVAAIEKKAEDKVGEEDNVWRRKNEEAREEDFQRELREALIQSTIEARNYEKLMREMKEAEAALVATGLSNRASKKPTKMSLQELHRLPSLDVTLQPEPSPKAVKDPPSLDAAFPLSPVDVTEDSPFSPLLEDVEAEVEKVMTRENRPSKESDQDREMMGPRIAQLKDELEKKDKVIAKLKKDNTALKKSLTEAKERNQSLCTIMNQGEFSKKVELLKQVNELSAIKNDLALEVETLSSSLEQERSRNKALKAQVHQITNSHTKSKN